LDDWFGDHSGLRYRGQYDRFHRLDFLQQFSTWQLNN
jgi:hypothetical protein